MHLMGEGQRFSARLKQNFGSSQGLCGAPLQVDTLPIERSSHSIASIQTTKQDCVI